ncbi:MAG: Gmad2 immunoglobulin-like domain-containing protein [Jiangellaceae bacterium]
MSHDESRDEDLLRRALRDEADRVLPSHDALDRIQQRTRRPVFWRNPVVLGMAAAATTAAAVIVGGVVVLDGATDGDTTASGDTSPAVTSDGGFDSTAPSAPPSTAPSTPATETSPLVEPAEEDTVPVYYLAETAEGDLRLTREFRTVPAPDGPLVAAVRTMLDGAPKDPDYRGPWDRATEVLSVEIRDGVIDVDLGGMVDYAGANDETATIATQQLVYTVTAAAREAGEAPGPLPVRILVEGEPVGKLWGQLDVSQPVERAPQAEVRQLVQINDPSDGDVVSRSFTVRGEAAVFEANVLWEIRNEVGEVVQSDFTTALQCCTFAPFEFTVELQPGSYTVVVSEDDPSDGGGRAPMSDSRNFRVD